MTEADERAEARDRAALRALTPDIPIVAEEAVARRRSARRWAGASGSSTRWTAPRSSSAATASSRSTSRSIEDGVPVLGVVLRAGASGACSPARPGTGALVEAGRPAARDPLPRCRRPRPHGGARAARTATPRRWTPSWPGARWPRSANAGSSLKLCLVAAGEADLYPRLGRTMEWDIAAGHAVLRGRRRRACVTLHGEPLRYGKPGFENPHFVAEGPPAG
ncbi:MAG: 3'(2'),5'-bisphosphate nucleotidase CysQ [Comamonadaceae bacterium]|nr:3'(2'),5'-bisphosphate nucleotidase CysQ [Comamonadaceae bacterium]